MLGAGGGLLRGALAQSGRKSALLWLAVGIGGTIVYDLLTNVAQGFVFGSLAATFALGALPALQHIASNGVIFFVIGRLAAPWLAREKGSVDVAA
jgi:hypothetical protein